MANKKYAPRIPFQVDDQNNIKSIEAVLENCTQLLKLMEPAFGAGIRKLLFENQAQLMDENLEQKLTALIKGQASTYASDLIVGKITVYIENNTLYLSIPYNYKNYFADVATFGIPLQG
jgi:hypothetical protein